MKRLMGIVNGVVSALLVLLLLGVGFVALTAKGSPDGIPTFRGYKALSVISGSMEPAIHTGDVIIIRPVARAEEVADGDIITYRTKENRDMLITHRVIGTVKVNGAPTAFVTKGDANQSEDLSTVAFSQIVGRYQFRVPYFGYISSFIRKPAGIVTVVIIPGLLLIGMEFRKIWKALSEAEAAKAAQPEGEAGKRE
ncbi:MAG: signal peptidase I [Bacillota bacterium]